MIIKEDVKDFTKFILDTTRNYRNELSNYYESPFGNNFYDFFE